LTGGVDRSDAAQDLTRCGVRPDRIHRIESIQGTVGEVDMRSFLPSSLLFALAMAPSAAIAGDSQAPSESRNEMAEAVHVQPRGRSFAAGSAEDVDIQRKLESFNKAQQSLDKVFDEKLTICRRC
jgi:hypothetical protein